MGLKSTPLLWSLEIVNASNKLNLSLDANLCLPSEAFHVNNIQELSPYRKENTTLHRYKDQPVNAV
jgi:hypothetical protein